MRHYIPCLFLAGGLLSAGCGGKEDSAPSTPETPASSATTINLGTAPAASASTPTPAPGAPPAPAQEIAPAAERLEKGTPAYEVLIQAIQSFSIHNERSPKDLDELVKAKYLRALPPAPEGKKFHYDPDTHFLSVVPK